MQPDTTKVKIISSLTSKPLREAGKYDIIMIKDELFVLGRSVQGELAVLAKTIRSNIEKMRVNIVCDTENELIYSYEPPPHLQGVLEPGWVVINKG